MTVGVPAAPEPSADIPECTMCHRPAACLGSYENNTSWGYSCNECCGHGNEDGRCFPLADVPAHYLALVTANDRLDEQWHEAVERSESAEAQLAGVRTIVSDHLVGAGNRVNASACMYEIQRLVFAAPSPGAGEKT